MDENSTLRASRSAPQVQDGALSSREMAIADYAAAEARKLAIEECAKAVEGMRACPFAKGQTAPDISPDEPCPVCGDLGTLDTIGKPSKCEDAASTIRSLLPSTAASVEATEEQGSRNREEPISSRLAEIEG